MANRQDLVNLLSKKNPVIKKEDIAFVVNSVFQSISDSLVQKGRVEIRHFGAFSIRKRKFSPESSLKNDNAEKMREIDVVYYRASQSVIDIINN